MVSLSNHDRQLENQRDKNVPPILIEMDRRGQQFSVKYRANALTAGLENPAYRDRRDILVPY
ncbi:MAG: hypothetical protein HZA08_00355 [Nitrospirae bacterium]|nr:hypothetical protein [Nitrospirota bacterium]